MKIIRKIVGFVLVVALVVVAGFAIRYFGAFNSFLDKITARRPETKQYSVVVLNDSGFEKIESLADKSVGFLKTDPKAANAEQMLTEAVTIYADYYDDVGIMVEALEHQIIDAISLENDRLQMLQEEKIVRIAGDEAEEDNNTAPKVRVIHTFEIELESDNLEIPDKKITDEPFILYISGSDARNGIKETARSDVNIVVVVNPKLGRVLLVSIPRDTYVQLHGTTGIKDKLTHAGLYSVEMSKTTIEDFLDISIDYTLKVSFDTVVQVVDQLDGIDIFSDNPMTLKNERGKTCTYVYGKQHVDGDCALRFARERKSYYTGDKHRGQNQQQVLTGIIERLSSSKEYLLKIPAILDITADSFETTISRDNISAFIGMQLTKQIKWQIESISIDGTGTYTGTYTLGENRMLYVMIADMESVASAQEKIAAYLSGEILNENTGEVNEE